MARRTVQSNFSFKISPQPPIAVCVLHVYCDWKALPNAELAPLAHIVCACVYLLVDVRKSQYFPDERNNKFRCYYCVFIFYYYHFYYLLNAALQSS